MSRKTTQQKQVNEYVKHIRFNTYFRSLPHTEFYLLTTQIDYNIENISQATFLNSSREADNLAHSVEPKWRV